VILWKEAARPVPEANSRMITSRLRARNDSSTRLVWPVYPFNPYTNTCETTLRFIVDVLSISYAFRGCRTTPPPHGTADRWMVEVSGFREGGFGPGLRIGAAHDQAQYLMEGAQIVLPQPRAGCLTIRVHGISIRCVRTLARGGSRSC